LGLNDVFMKIYNYTRYFSLIIFIFLISFSIANAQLNKWDKTLDNSAVKTNLYKVDGKEDDTSLRIATYVGKGLLVIPILGFIMIIQIVLAGYEWMTAAGEASKVENAQKRIRNAVIGIIILIALYGIADFIIKALAEAGGYDIRLNDEYNDGNYFP